MNKRLLCPAKMVLIKDSTIRLGLIDLIQGSEQIDLGVICLSYNVGVLEEKATELFLSHGDTQQVCLRWQQVGRKEWARWCDDSSLWVTINEFHD